MHILYIHIYIYKGMSQTLLAPLNFEACHSKIVEWNSKVLDFFKTKGPPFGAAKCVTMLSRIHLICPWAG